MTEERPLRIGYLSHHNPHSRRAFSGTAHFMVAALSRAPGIELRLLGTHLRNLRLHRLARRLGIAGRPGPRPRDFEGLDAVLCLAPGERALEAAAAVRAPLVIVTDATPGFLREFYGWQVEEEKAGTEARALARADRVIYSSRFMAERAAAEFGPELAARTHVIPFGVNLDDLPGAPMEKPPLDRIELLFVARAWERKGGPVALAALDALAAAGVPARLTVVGCDPGLVRPDLAALGFLDKNRPEDAARLTRAFARAHLFVLPTRADCTPMVVAEANAHATPVLITETGGIPSLMAPGINGEMLPPGADGAAWAARIRALTADAAAYRALSLGAFAHYRDRLNWDAWVRDFRAVLAGLGLPAGGVQADISRAKRPARG